MIGYDIIPLEEVNILFADYVQRTLNLSQDKVLIAYREKGQISSVIGDNVVYVYSKIEQDEISNVKERAREYNPVTNKIKNIQHSMRTLSINFTFYGPNSLVLSSALNDSFTLEDGKEFLYKNNMALIPSETRNGVEIHEKINDRWWKRSDLEIKVYNSIRTYEEVNPVESAEVKYVLRSGSHDIEIGGNE